MDNEQQLLPSTEHEENEKGEREVCKLNTAETVAVADYLRENQERLKAAGLTYEQIAEEVEVNLNMVVTRNNIGGMAKQLKLDLGHSRRPRNNGYGGITVRELVGCVDDLLETLKGAYQNSHPNLAERFGKIRDRLRTLAEL